MKNINALRWLSILAIIGAVALLEWVYHFRVIKFLSCTASCVLDIVCSSIIIFCVLTWAFGVIDKQSKKITALNESLEEANKGLEKKVEQKTSQLNAALEHLQKEHDELKQTCEKLTSAYQEKQKDDKELAKRESYALKEEKIEQLAGVLDLKLKSVFDAVDKFQKENTDSAVKEKLSPINNAIVEAMGAQEEVRFWLKSVNLKDK